MEKLLGELKILKGRTIGFLGWRLSPTHDRSARVPPPDIARN